MMAWLTVFLKEVRENTRDRRSMISTFVFGPLFGPIFLAAILGFAVKVELDRAEKPLEVAVVGSENAPNLIKFLIAQGLEIKKAPSNPEEAVRKREQELVMRVPEDFAKHWREGKPATIEIIRDASQQKTMASYRRLQGVLRMYGTKVQMQRLILRGIDPELTTPVRTSDVDLSTAQSRSGLLLGFLPYLLILTVLTGGLYLAIDSTAGERERQSLEPLLINPVGRGQIMTGKLLATALFASCSLALTLILQPLALKLLPLERLDLTIQFGAREALLLFLFCWPLAFVGAALQVSMAAFSKSFREAQTYITYLMILPAIPAMLNMINPINPEPWMYAVPFIGQQFLIDQTLRGDPLNMLHIGLSVGISFALAALIGLFAARLYHRESLAISA